ncbi:MAG: hypothetical protein AAF585_17060 [Verrucomicrobiota bacterium]
MLKYSLFFKLGAGLAIMFLSVGCMEKNPYHVPAPEDGLYTLVLVLDGDFSDDDALKKIRPSGQYSRHVPAQEVNYDTEKKVTVARFHRLPDAQPIYYQRQTITHAAKQSKELFEDGIVLELFLINSSGAVMNAKLDKPEPKEE